MEELSGAFPIYIQYHTVDILSPPGYVATDFVLSTNNFYSVPLGLVCSKRM